MARQIYKIMSESVLKVARGLKDGEDYRAFVKTMVFAPLECMANFVTGSRIFRAGVRDSLEETTFQDSLGFLLSAGFIESLSEDEASIVQHFLTSIASSLAFNPDSLLWAIDKGLLEMVASILGASPFQQLSDYARLRESPISRCTGVLLRLLDSEATTEKLRAHDALTLFRPHKRKINGAYSELKPWKYFERRLEGRPVDEDWKVKAEIKEGTCGGIVCSWKQCRAGRKPSSGKKFGKCGGCQVARYCSKEHQRLHWSTHKIHCRAGQAKSPP
ncbi:hypothetical protein KFL_002300135 [Klebsormidium nitens]|uniref:MYND-type domain-containing protein n=1 Tax=Klebsormidium nitens TaxID=105231 RepID=A0A1Y1I342_KLENI|nr:hypothetical protein KFL_002300135 [Klebsormidium nitens]|eukprot:GAQ85344.1 hypothetical protein KFL_002300135 [Klebsormidium nitens]